MMKQAIMAAFLAAVSLPAAAYAGCPSPSSDQTISVPGRPFAAEPSPDNCHLFVSLMPEAGKGALAVLDNDGGTFHLGRIIRMPRGTGGGLALSHDARTLAVTTEDAIILFDVARLYAPDQNPIAGVIPDMDSGSIYAQFSRDDALLFISEERRGSLAVINTASALQGLAGKALTGRIPVGRAPVGLALSADGAYLFSTSEVASASEDCKAEQGSANRHGKGAVFAIDIVKAASQPRQAATGMILAGCNPVRVIASGDGHALWISQRGDGRVMSFDPALLLPNAGRGHFQTVEVGTSPVGLALRQDGKELWVADSDRFSSSGGALTMLDLTNPAQASVAQTIRVGHFPRDLRFLPDGRTLAVALFGDNAVLLHVTPAG